jgi:hypothetical protein
MAKKSVAVSLRKPPPADLAALVVEAVAPAIEEIAFDSVPQASSDAAPRRATKRKRPVRAPATAQEAAVEAPPPATTSPSFWHADVEEADAFVSRATMRRNTTIQLPQDVADRLAAFCTLHGREANDVVAEIIAAHLAAQRPSNTSLRALFEAAATATFERLVTWIREKLRLVVEVRNRVVSLGWSVLGAF